MSAAAPSRSRRRRWRKRLLALCLALLVALLAGELLVRAAIGAPWAERLPILRVEPDPARGWRMVAGEDHYTYTHRVRVNALGLRGDEVPEAKPPGERRVLVLGDSMIYGQGVGENDTLPARLERELRERTREEATWRVVNAGHRAYNTAQELALLDQLGARIAPDVVVLCWFDNDLHPIDIEQLHDAVATDGSRAFDANAPLEGSVLLRWHAKQFLRKSALLMFLHDLANDLREAEAEPGYYADGFARLERHLARFRERCDTLGADPLFTVVPHPAVLAGDAERRGRADRALRLAREADLRTVDLRPTLLALVDELGERPLIPYDGHYLPIANARMAQVLAAALAGDAADE